MKLGDLTRPGPGFTPLLTGALLGCFGLILLILSVRRHRDETRQLSVENEKTVRNWKAVIVCVFALLGHAIILETLGFYTTTGLFLCVLFKMGYPQKWGMPLILVSLTIVISYLLFTVGLKIYFPGGITGF